MWVQRCTRLTALVRDHQYRLWFGIAFMPDTQPFLFIWAHDRHYNALVYATSWLGTYSTSQYLYSGFMFLDCVIKLELPKENYTDPGKNMQISHRKETRPAHLGMETRASCCE